MAGRGTSAKPSEGGVENANFTLKAREGCAASVLHALTRCCLALKRNKPSRTVVVMPSCPECESHCLSHCGGCCMSSYAHSHFLFLRFRFLFCSSKNLA